MYAAAARDAKGKQKTEIADKEGIVDFAGDTIQEAKFALIADLCK